MHKGLTELFLKACTNVAWRHLDEVVNAACEGCRHNQRDHDCLIWLRMVTDDMKIKTYSVLALARSPYTVILAEFCRITRQAYMYAVDDSDPEKRFGVLDMLDFIECDLLTKVRFEPYWQNEFIECMRKATCEVTDDCS